jgi:hypothetical protein
MFIIFGIPGSVEKLGRFWKLNLFIWLFPIEPGVDPCPSIAGVLLLGPILPPPKELSLF